MFLASTHCWATTGQSAKRHSNGVSLGPDCGLLLDVYLVLTVCVMYLFIVVFWICLQSVIVAFPAHTHLRFMLYVFLHAIFYLFQIHEGLDGDDS